jgi:hypothetical protein
MTGFLDKEYLMRNQLLIAILIMATTIGCSNEKTVTYSKQQYASIIQCEAYVVSKTANPVPQVKYDRKNCPECKGKGIIKSGDGIHDETCPFCEVKKSEAPPEEDSVSLPNYNCCKHCVCPNCSCTYPGQCLINKNNGWPVKICDDDNTCVVYMPEDENGNKYNPYDLVPKEKKAQYSKYKEPTPFDAKGNPL